MKNVVQASDLAKLTEPGRYRVSERLYLQITPTGVRSWVFRYKRNGVERQKGLGPLRTVSLSKAKARARALSDGLTKGIDPIPPEGLNRSVEMSVPTFAEAAQTWYAGKRWRSARHSDQVINLLRRYAFETLGEMPVNVIDVRDAPSPTSSPRRCGSALALLGEPGSPSGSSSCRSASTPWPTNCASSDLASQCMA